MVATEATRSTPGTSNNRWPVQSATGLAPLLLSATTGSPGSSPVLIRADEGHLLLRRVKGRESWPDCYAYATVRQLIKIVHEAYKKTSHLRDEPVLLKSCPGMYWKFVLMRHLLPCAGASC